ncbi:unnamed protein product [Victoria cruziana]
MAGEEPRRSSFGSSSGRIGLGESIREAWSSSGGDVFRRNASMSSAGNDEEGDEEDLKWAALEKLPTYNRMRKSILRVVAEDGSLADTEVVDVRKLGKGQRRELVDRALRFVDNDNEKFLLCVRERIDRVELEVPKIEVRFEGLSIEGDAYVGNRALPTLLNATINVLEGILGLVRLSRSKKKVVKILKEMSGILKPSRMTLLLGPPGSGKTTLLLALAGKSDKQLRVKGRITYNGHELSEFVPARTCAYISQHDVHNGQMTVRETLDFSGRCLGVGTRYEMLSKLLKRETEAGIKPDHEIDAFMKAAAQEGQKSNLATDYVLKVLGLDICADIMVGDEMRRGVSGGQKKRVSTGEMLVGPAKAFFMDEISTGLDSSTTFQIVKYMRQMVHVMDGTMLMSLLQPAPETFNLFDDIILLSEGYVVYQGPREEVIEFFEFMGFKCPSRKGVADFLQEVTSKKDQKQYWCNELQSYRFISAAEFSQAFNSFRTGQRISDELKTPFDKSRSHPAALAKKKYGISSWELFKACFSREWLLMRRNAFIYVFKTTQITIMSIVTMSVFFRTQMKHETVADGLKYSGALFFGLINVMFIGMAELSLTVGALPVFYKHRDFLFYPAWAYAFPKWLIRMPMSILESTVWVALTYYTIGFAPSPTRFFRQLLAYICTHNMALSLFRFIAAVGRTLVTANTIGSFTLLLVFNLGGFVVSRDQIKPWWIWGYWLSPLMYGQNAIAINEFLDDRWDIPNKDTNIDAPTIGKAILKTRGMFTEEYFYWVAIGVLIGYSFLLNVCFILALTYLNPVSNHEAVCEDQHENEKGSQSESGQAIEQLQNKLINPQYEGDDTGSNNTTNKRESEVGTPKRGMVLPFQPLSLAFNHLKYYVDMPPEMKGQGVDEDRLQLLRDVSGSFRPGILTALMGSSGAGKTTLMDVLAGRKTGGYIEGSITISGYPKQQQTFARISGYCEQNDIHSPNVTVYESLIYSGWLRLSPEINVDRRKLFVEEIMELVELNPIRNTIVGLPGVSGLSTEQRKRLTIAVELVANPSIIFMDEPTSGLDARAAAIVMRAVRNTVDTGRTVVCTIHQPSIDIFEAFDELLLMRRGGQVIYAGALGHESSKLVDYFQAIPGVPEIGDGDNPANWMLEVTNAASEAQLGLDFAVTYSNSSLYRENMELINELSTPLPGSKDLFFPTRHAQSFVSQCRACFWKQSRSYWRNPQYNALRFFMTIATGLIFGTIFWGAGSKTGTQQQLLNLLGAMYTVVMFLGINNAMSVQPVVSIERTVFYRERAAGMYSTLPYTIGQVAIEVAYILVQTFIYSLILFSCIGFTFGVVRYLQFLYFVSMAFLYFTLYGMVGIALTPSHHISPIIVSFFFSFWNLFSGFLITRPVCVCFLLMP